MPLLDCEAPDTSAVVSIDVTELGAVSGGSSIVNYYAIQAAINKGKVYSQYFGGAIEVLIPGGQYTVSQKLDLTDCHGLQVRGMGNQATEVIAEGNFAVFWVVGTSGVNLQSVTLRDMLLVGSGKANANSMGIYAEFTNSCAFFNIHVFSTNIAIGCKNVWQQRVNDINVDGSGLLQNNYGLYMYESTAGVPDNAVVCSGFYAASCAIDGFRIINGQGSKFFNCEAGGCGVNGWHIGEPTTGTYKSEFLHIDNCLADSCGSHGWKIIAGTATSVQYMQLSNVWSGNNNGYGFWVEGANDIILGNVQAHGNNDGGVHFYNSAQCVLNGAVMNGNIVSNNPAVGDVLLNGGGYHIVSDVKSSPLHQKSILEAAGTDNNTISDCQFINGGTLIGVNNQVSGNRGIDNYLGYGKLGIGLAPSYRLDVLGGTGLGARVGKLLALDNSPFITGANLASANPVAIGSTSADHLYIFTNNAERVRVTSGGNVGIGTTGPSTKLHVTDTAANAQIMISDSGTSSSFQQASGLYINAGHGGAGNAITFRASGFFTTATLSGAGAFAAAASVAAPVLSVDATFYSYVAGFGPAINYDSGDFAHYDRTSNVFKWSIANTLVASITSGGFVGALTGNATTATAWATGRSLTGDVTSSAFDGTGNIATTLATTQGAVHTWSLTQTFTVAPVFTAASGTRTALGLGTAATQNTGTSGANVPLLNAANTWSLTQTIPNVTFDATFYQYVAGFGPTVNYDTNDFQYYDRTGNAYYWYIANVEVLHMGGGELAVVGSVKTNTTTVAGLGTATAGRRWMVTDATIVAAGNFGNVVVGGGANTVPVYADGTNWRIG